LLNALLANLIGGKQAVPGEISIRALAGFLLATVLELSPAVCCKKQDSATLLETLLRSDSSLSDKRGAAGDLNAPCRYSGQGALPSY